MTQDQIYQNIAQRTGGDIFIKRFAELMLLPRIKNEAQRARAKDELPQSAAGRTIMTTEPKFIPEKAVSIDLKAGERRRVEIAMPRERFEGWDATTNTMRVKPGNHLLMVGSSSRDADLQTISVSIK